MTIAETICSLESLTREINKTAIVTHEQKVELARLVSTAMMQIDRLEGRLKFMLEGT